MPASVCPKCRRNGSHLAASSEHSIVDYYRCEWCKYVWMITKKPGTSKDVTDHPKSNKAAS